MLVFSAITPHSPLLIPTIGKEHRESLAQTLDAYRILEEHLYTTKPDTIVLISPHATYYPDGFSCNVAPDYTGELKEFGDHGTTVQAKGDALFIDHVHRHMREVQQPFSLMSEEKLDYGMTITLSFLLNHLPTTKIVPLSISGLSMQQHATFGQELMQVIHAETRRIALIATSDLSHAIHESASGGVADAGPTFETAVKEAVTKMRPDPIMALSAETLKDAKQCAAQPITMLLGAIQDVHLKPVILSYEASFGVGMLAAEFELL